MCKTHINETHETHTHETHTHDTHTNRETHANRENISRFNNIISRANQANLKMPDKRMRSLHVAYLLKGRKIIYQALNDYNRCYIDGTYHTSIHAEINVMRSLKDKKSSLDLLVIRIDRSSGMLCESLPCNNCRNALIMRGFKNIYCSRSDGFIEKIRLSDIPTYYTTAWKKYKKLTKF